MGSFEDRKATGTVFNIQKYSVHDGPGIRTIVFLKGCPLSCKWCSNPESQASHPQVAYNKGRCIGCLYCMAACPYQVRNRNEKTGAVDKCRFCHVSNYENGTEMCTCVTACPTHARIFGDLDDPDCELVKEINRTHAAPIAGDLTKSKVFYVR